MSATNEQACADPSQALVSRVVLLPHSTLGPACLIVTAPRIEAGKGLAALLPAAFTVTDITSTWTTQGLSRKSLCLRLIGYSIAHLFFFTTVGCVEDLHLHPVAGVNSEQATARMLERKSCLQTMTLS